jgi:predicted DNA-binding transcriptional regulator AlpA
MADLKGPVATKAAQRPRLDARAVIEAWIRERGLRGLDNGGSPVRVLNLDEVAKRADTTRRNIERLVADGTGPAVVRISKRKIGVLEQDFVAWLHSRRRPATSKADGPEGPSDAQSG